MQVMAHPHVFVKAKVALVFDDEGYLTALKHTWVFDDMYSVYALQGVDANGNGEYDGDELEVLKELATASIEGLEEFGYFTFGDDSKVELDFKPPHSPRMFLRKVGYKDYWLLSDDDLKAIEEERAAGRDVEQDATINLLELHFTLPLKERVKADKPLTIDVYDPTYYIDYKWDQNNAVSLVNAPFNCKTEVINPPELDWQTAAKLGSVGADVRELPDDLKSVADTLVNQAIVSCGAKAQALRAEQLAMSPIEKAKNSKEAVNAFAKDSSVQLSDIKPQQLESAKDKLKQELEGRAVASTPSISPETTSSIKDATTKSADDLEKATPEPKNAELEKDLRSNVDGSYYARLMGSIAMMQNEFFNKLRSALRSFQHNENAIWWLMLVSFAYGIFHAAGPGHGKAIISSYVLADEQTLKKGILLSFASALAQAVTAIVLVGGIAGALHFTSIALDRTSMMFEKGSYILVLLLGLWLVWERVFRPMYVKRKVAACNHSHHDHHDHHHHTHHDHGHAHHEHTDHGHESHKHEHTHAHEVCSSCGHNHSVDPAMLRNTKMSITGAWSIIVAVGLRPCTGALIVLAFAMSQGLLWAGVASTLVMGIGTGITVSILASMAVLARDVALKIWGDSNGAIAFIHRGFEIGGALLVLVVGLTMFLAGFHIY